MEGNCSQYDPAAALPQIQLFQNFPICYSAGPINYTGNQCAAVSNLPINRVCELGISPNNNFLQDGGAGNTGGILNHNPVSTGLRLSYEEDEWNSSISLANEGLQKTLPSTLPLSSTLKVEIDRQQEELDNYIRSQEANLLKGIKELKQRQNVRFLNTLKKGAQRKLQDKELEIQKMKTRNKELTEEIKRIATEAQTWHYRAKYNESVIIALQSNLDQVIAQGAAQVREGCGETNVDDAASYAGPNQYASNQYASAKKQMNCRNCEGKEVCVVLMPCKHLCLCKDCEFVDVCPVCNTRKFDSVEICLS